ncbi:MAG: DNA-protecting protein DprA [Desulfuromonas sp.]|nr:MAG: DNA-protecting protein DprA [Desulfuromonas sp.]
MPHRTAWLRLLLTPGLGRTSLSRLVDCFADPQSIIEAAAEGWPQLPALRRDLAREIPGEGDPRVAKALQRLDQQDVRLISGVDDDYPEPLRQIPDPPVVLFVRGLWPPPAAAIAIVGTRRPSPTGTMIAADFAEQLAEAGLAIVSGLARGIDAAAHRGALQGGGLTLAVLGCGIDRVYPPENTRLHRQIAEHGTLLSEYLPGTPPMPGHFPGRNRIISGLTRGVLVVEAAVDSGSLITADFALDQGREVMAVPGNITQPTSYGPNLLIKQGAQPVTDVSDILNLLGQAPQWQPCRRREVRVVEELGEPASSLLASLDTTPRHIDHLALESGLTPMNLFDILLHLELQGLVRQLPGARFVRC